MPRLIMVRRNGNAGSQVNILHEVGELLDEGGC